MSVWLELGADVFHGRGQVGADENVNTVVIVVVTPNHSPHHKYKSQDIFSFNLLFAFFMKVNLPATTLSVYV